MFFDLVFALIKAGRRRAVWGVEAIFRFFGRACLRFLPGKRQRAFPLSAFAYILPPLFWLRRAAV